MTRRSAGSGVAPAQGIRVGRVHSRSAGTKGRVIPTGDGSPPTRRSEKRCTLSAGAQKAAIVLRLDVPARTGAGPLRRRPGVCVLNWTTCWHGKAPQKTDRLTTTVLATPPL